MPRVVAECGDVIPALAEVFREHGYEGASLSATTRATGLGKGGWRRRRFRAYAVPNFRTQRRTVS